MKRIFTMVLLTLLQKSAVHAQHVFDKRLVITEQNDFFNIAGKGTDNSYTNGTRIDISYQKQPADARGLGIDLLFPTAGKNAVNTYSWSVMQYMMTPNDISTPVIQPNDYPYSGALLVGHSLRSYNKSKGLTLQTELLAGVRGSASLAKQTQRSIHRLINYTLPEGWDNQLKNQVLINLELAVEKTIFQSGNRFEISGAGRIGIGSFADFVSFNPYARIGKLPVMNSRSVNIQSVPNRQPFFYYFQVRPQMTYLAYNSMVEGKTNGAQKESESANYSSRSVSHFLPELQVGAVVGKGRFSISYFQLYSRAYIKGLYNHSVGSIGLMVGL